MGVDITLRPVNPHLAAAMRNHDFLPSQHLKSFLAVEAQHKAKRAKRTDFSWHNQCFYSAVFKSMRTEYVAFQT